MNAWALFWFLALVLNLMVDASIVRELRELRRQKSKNPSQPSPQKSQGWKADVKKRGVNPKQTLDLEGMPESEAVRHLLKMGYKPEDIQSLEPW